MKKKGWGMTGKEDISTDSFNPEKHMQNNRKMTSLSD